MFSKETLSYQERNPQHPIFNLEVPLTPKDADHYMHQAPWQVRVALAEREDYFIPELFPKGLGYIMEHETSRRVITAFLKRKDFAIFHSSFREILNKHNNHPELIKANEYRLNLPLTDEEYDKIIQSNRYQLIRGAFEMKNLKLTPERIEYAMTHLQDTVRETIAKRTDWTPTKEQSLRGLRDGEHSVVCAWLQRKDVSYTQKELKDAFGDWREGLFIKNHIRLSAIQRSLIELSNIHLEPELITNILKYNSLGVGALMKRNDIKYTTAQLKIGQNLTVKHISEYFFNQQNKQEREKLKKMFVQPDHKPTPNAL